MKDDLRPHRSPDVFRIILVLTGILLSISIIIAQFAVINLGLILITLGIAGMGAIISTVFAKRIAVRIGKEPFARIFVSFSYSDFDTKFVDKLTYELVQRGFEILRADHAVLAGDISNEKIKELLLEADFFIVVISNKSLQSESVLNETIFFKQERERKIFPLLIEETKQSGKLSDVVSEIQYVIFIKNFNEGLKKLVYALDENVAKVSNKQGRNNQ